MDLFVLPASGDGIPLAVEEAMACGLPVVAAGGGELAKLVAPEAGVLVRPRDELALRCAVEALANRPLRARSMGEAGRRRAQEFSIARIAEEYEQIYRG
jgi:glycosyltransferase involved in cell wall biosynthesis